jgi:peptidyl-prolyl cis-trans isomerase B (cyclophilin B)
MRQDTLTQLRQVHLGAPSDARHRSIVSIGAMVKRSVLAVAVTGLLVLSGCSSEDPDTEAKGEGTTQTPSETPSDSPSDSPTESPSEKPSESPKTDESEEAAPQSHVTCDYEADASVAAREVDAPPAKAPARGTVTAVVTVGQGDITLRLDREKAPCTVNSFVSLAEQGFYDDTPCPRLGNSPGFGILQCGDPSGTTGGGPGYSFADELAGDEVYPAGTLAMANAGPDTNGSQFFFVFADSSFPPAYTVFGQIDKAGLKILSDVAAKGDDGSSPAGGGAPNEKVQIEKVTITRG